MFSTILKSLRSDQNLTQEMLAKKLNVTKGAIAMWETGKRKPDSEMLVSIASFFNVSTDYLLGNTKCQDTNSSTNPKDDLSDTHSKSNTSQTVSYKHMDYLEHQITIESFYNIDELDIYETPYNIQRKDFKDANGQTYYIFAIAYTVSINNKDIWQTVYFDTYEYFEHVNIQGRKYIEKFDYDNLYGLINATYESQKNIKLKILRTHNINKSNIKCNKYLYLPIVQTQDDNGTPIICLLSVRNSFTTYNNLISKLKSQNIIK